MGLFGLLSADGLNSKFLGQELFLGVSIWSKKDIKGRHFL